MKILDQIRDWMYPRAETHRADAAMPPEVQAVDAALRTVFDPEFGLNLVDMGLVRGIRVEGSRAMVRLTLTTEGCPVGPLILSQVDDALVAAGFTPEVQLEFDPPWSPDDLSPEGRAALGR